MRESHLKLKQVQVSDFPQYNQLMRYVFQVTEQTLSSVGWEEREIMRAKYPTLQQAEIWGWFDGDSLVSQLAIYPMEINVFNKQYKMGGLTGVGTYPEYANKGLMHKLIEKALHRMRENGQYISYLFPYSIPYYRRKGWEIISDKISYEVKDYQLPKNRQVKGFVQRVQPNSEEVKTCYERFSLCCHGAVLRDELAWNEYWLWDNDDIIVAIYYNEDNIPDGYLIYWISNDIFYIKDMIVMNEEAHNGLWNFITAHFSMIDTVKGDCFTGESLAFLLEDANIQEIISPYYMARIVDFEQFIAEYPFKPSSQKREWKFYLSDPLLECNQGNFRLTVDNDGRGRAEKINEHCRDFIDIQTMTTMLMSYKRPSYLKKIERMKTDFETVSMLENSIEQTKPYVSDYF